MSQFADDLNRYCRRYRVRTTDRLLLLAHYPMFKVCWLADYGSGPVKKVSLLLCDVFRRYRFRHRIFPAGGHSLSISLSFNHYDYGIYHQIFWGDEYICTSGLQPIKTLVDLGANIGMASLWFWANNSQLEKIVLVEPNPQILDRLKANLVPLLNTKQAEIENVCISDQSGREVSFFCSPDHTGSALSEGDAAAESQQVSVPSCTLDVLLDRHGLDTVDLVKMDIEGAEHEVIRNPESLKRCRFLVVEIHGNLERRDFFAHTVEDVGFAVKRFPLSETHELLFGQNKSEFEMFNSKTDTRKSTSSLSVSLS